MSATSLSAELIADAIANCIQEGKNEYGILITSLTGFDIEQVILKIGIIRASGANIRLAVQGFGDNERLKDVATKAGFRVPEEFDTTLRAAGRWRNHWKEEGTRVAIAQGRQPVMHTLGQFQPITNVQVAHQLLKWAKENVAVNEQHKNLYNALETEEDFASLLSPQLIADYLASLDELDPVRRLTATFENLWYLGLLPDPRLFGGLINTDTNTTIAARLKRNMEIVRQLRDPDQSLRAYIENTLKRMPTPERSEIETSLTWIDAYQHSFDNALLANLNLDKVEDALQPQRVLGRLKKAQSGADAKAIIVTNNSSMGINTNISTQDLDSESVTNIEEELVEQELRKNEQVTPNAQAAKFNRERLDQYFAKAILNGEDEECDKIMIALAEAIENYSSKEDKGTVRVKLGDQEIEEKVDEKLLNFVRKFCSDINFGGQVRTKENSMRAAIDLIETAEEVQCYNPASSTSIESDTSLAELLNQFDTWFNNLGLRQALDRFVEHRHKLLPLLSLLTVDPFIAISPSYLDLCDDYLKSVNQLMEIIRSNYDQMREISEQGARYCLAQLVSLDTVLLKCGEFNNETYKAILMPLHPMYLWVFVELVKIGKRLRNDPSQYTEEDRKAFLTEMTKERHFLNVLCISDYITGSSSLTLPLSGSISGLPCFENTSNHYSGTDGLAELFNVIEHYCAQYRLFINPLRIAIIDSPSVDETLALASKLLSDTKLKDLPCLQIDLFFTITGASRNYLSTMLSPENEQIYQELIVSGRLHMLIKLEELPLYDIIAKFEQSPVHILALFDQSNVRTREFTQLVMFNTSPLCITREFNYDAILDELRANPVSKADIFSAYNFFVSRLKNELANRNYGVVADAQGLKNIVEQVLQNENAQWLYIADRVLPSETNLKADRLLARSANRRQTITLAASFDHFARSLTELLSRYNLYPRAEAVMGLMRDFANLISEGLLMLIRRNDGSFIEAKQKGLLGLLLAARDYHQLYADSLVVSVDDPTSKLWLRISSTEQRADLLGVRLDGEDNFLIDVIEVKTREGSEDQLDLYDEEQGIAKGKAIDQINSTKEALSKVFKSTAPGNPEPPLVPPRREVLRELFYQECQSRRHSKEFRKIWIPRLNEMFKPDNAERVHIGGYIYEIALRQDMEIKQKTIKVETLDTLIHRTLGSMRVQSLLDMPFMSELPVRQVSEEVQMAVQAVASKKRPIDDNPNTIQVKTSLSSSMTLAKDNINSISTTPIESDKSTTPISTEPLTTNRAVKENSEVEQSWLLMVARSFINACGNFGINIVECDIHRVIVGPTIVRFPFKIASGQTKRRLDQYLEDIGREMSITNILIQQIQNSRYLALDVPIPIDKRKEYDFISDGLLNLPKITSAEQMPLALGVLPTGEVMICDLREVVHILIGGATGAGKTIFLYTVILSLLARHPNPTSLELILCTSKPEDFTFFERIPHLRGRPIIGSAKGAIEEIKKISGEILMERSNLLIQDRVRTIEDYNRKREEKGWLNPIVIIVDEFADLCDQVNDDKKAREAFYTNIRQIAQAGRNRGIHLVLCTQRPTADLIPGSIKSQMNARVALKMNSSLDSRIILDQDGAERLQGKGDLLFKDPNILERLQGYSCHAYQIETFLESLNKQSEQS